jgi:hypothetical protein
MDYNHDREPNLRLRKWRNNLGYGIGWKFKDALGDYIVENVLPWVIGILILLLVYTVKSHLVISWR